MLTETHPRTIGSIRQWLATACLMLGAFMNILDATIVNLALPAIRDDLGTSDNALQWVLVVYVLTFAAGLLPFGRFGDVYGRRNVFVLGLVGFMATSLAAGASPDTTTLIVARALQGLTAAAMVPQVLAIIHGLFAEDDRGKAIGYFGMISALGAIAGPVIGGAVISGDLFGLGWRAIFLINLPFGLVALAGVFSFLPAAADRAGGRADWTGALFFALAMAALVYPMIEGRSLGWPLYLAVFPVFAVLLALVFWQRQRSLGRLGRIQTLPTSLIVVPGFVTGVAAVMILISGMAGTMVVLAIFLQSGLGLTPAQAGLAIAPHPTAAMIASMITGRFGSRWLGLRITLGILVLLAGMVWLRLLVGGMDGGRDILAPLLLIGFGAGTAFVGLFQITLSSVSGPDAGAGSGALQAFQQVGIALGIAIVGHLFFSRLGGVSDPTIYRDAIGIALLYPIFAFAGLCLASLRHTLFGKGRDET
ncbi:MFS transporter [Aliiroseovarius sp. Z3]|uniref:MFS transporter n=1 Tax=Aliiroseovarius sp. Z3 TaxID=2811402 RepID=UPI0023B2C31B|nr:MFS transporter [Aliiroseovarius sp. Z3]MDE9451890.1 MFS transporter [Aliiroseovarius sp. Z3]MDE9452048.1 MFS transporter [Aliiroseovarius sp. Z3]